MTTDRYTRIVLTVIAASLAVDAGSRFFAIPAAMAAGPMTCKIDGTVDIKGHVSVEGKFGGSALQIKASDAIPIKSAETLATKVVKN
jgi:hypothetical protein